MAYTKKEKIKMYENALKGIKDLNLFFIEDVIALMPISKQTLYDFWPMESDELDAIKDLLDLNKVNEKIALRKLFKQGASAEKLALYKLICTDTERKALSMNHVDLTTDGEKIRPQETTVTFINARKDKKDKE